MDKEEGEVMQNALQNATPPQEGQIISPVTRTKCPFYGFMGLPGMHVDQEGNACALTGEHSPCSMEMANEPPCWDKCRRFNNTKNQEALKTLLETYNVFPREFEPYGGTSWTGINAMAWFRYITGHEFS